MIGSGFWRGAWWERLKECAKGLESMVKRRAERRGSSRLGRRLGLTKVSAKECGLENAKVWEKELVKAEYSGRLLALHLDYLLSGIQLDFLLLEI